MAKPKRRSYDDYLTHAKASIAGFVPLVLRPGGSCDRIARRTNLSSTDTAEWGEAIKKEIDSFVKGVDTNNGSAALESAVTIIGMLGFGMQPVTDGVVEKHGLDSTPLAC